MCILITHKNHKNCNFTLYIIHNGKYLRQNEEKTKHQKKNELIVLICYSLNSILICFVFFCFSYNFSIFFNLI